MSDENRRDEAYDSDAEPAQPKGGDAGRAQGTTSQESNEPNRLQRAWMLLRRGWGVLGPFDTQKVTAWAVVIYTAGTLVQLCVLTDSVNETRKATSLAERNAKHQLRPYVFLRRARYRGIVDGKVEYRVIVKNYGSTPADVTFSALLGVMDAARARGVRKPQADPF